MYGEKGPWKLTCNTAKFIHSYWQSLIEIQFITIDDNSYSRVELNIEHSNYVYDERFLNLTKSQFE